MTLRLKFNLSMLLAFVLGGAAIAYFLHGTLQDNAREAVLDKARVMREAALAMRSYTVDEVRPLLGTLSEERFLPQTVPSYAAQANFRRVSDTFSEYRYKEAALNPTNPTDRATDWEAAIIESFRRDPSRPEIQVVRDTPDGDVLSLAFPVQIRNEACLACHSTPSAAPESMIALYGEANGFGWQLDEVIGAQIVSVPMSVPLERAQQTFVLIMTALGITFLAIIVIMNLLLSYSVIRPVRRLTEAASEVSMGNLDAPEMEAKGSGEIASLTQSFNRMRRSLENAMRMIG